MTIRGIHYNEKSSLLCRLVEEDFGLSFSGKYAKADKHDSLVIDLENNVFFWNSKDIVGGPFEYLTKVRGVDPISAKRVVDSQISERYKARFTDEKDEDVVVYQELVDLLWRNGLDTRDYWYKRGLLDSTIDKFKLGYSKGWYVIPFRENGLLKNFQMRRDEPEKKNRHWYHGVGPLLFNPDILRFTGWILITEGTVDAIRLSQAGFPAVSHNQGAGWNDKWFEYFIRQDEIYYVCDNDEAGLKAGKKVANNLGLLRTKLITFDKFPDKYDTVDFFRDGHTKEEFWELMRNAKYAFEL